MRLLIIAERFLPQPGGLAASTHRIAANLAARDIEVHLLILTDDLEPGDLESGKLDQLVIHRLGRFRKFDRSYMVASRAIELLHRRHPFDSIIGIYLIYAGYLAAMQARLLGVPSLVMARGNDVDRELWRPERLPFLTTTLEWASAIGCVSTELTEKCRSLSDRDGIHFTPNSVNPEIFCPGEADPELKMTLGLGKGPVIGFSGEMRFKKGLHHFMEAALQISASKPGAHFMLLGGVREDDLEEYESIIKNEPSLEQVVVEVPYVKRQEKLASYYRLMDVIFLPSLWEGMPNAALEAMACGVPVVASSAGGLADLVDAPRTGFLFPPGDLDAAIESLTAALAMPGDVSRAMSKRARDRVLNDFTPEKEAGRIIEILEKLCAKEKPTPDNGVG